MFPECQDPSEGEREGDKSYWKAYEWYMWLLYYILSTLKGILPGCYLILWARFIKAISLLLTDSVMAKNGAEIILKMLVIIMKDLRYIKCFLQCSPLSSAHYVRDPGSFMSHVI